MAAGEEVRFDPGEELFVEARPADYLVGAAGGGDQPGAPGRPRGDGARRDGRARASGPVVSGPGTRTASTWRRAEAPRAAGSCGCRPSGCGSWPDAWFPFGVHLISGLVGTVRSIESVARQREALVALGTLAAGFAHEINNPASAATRAAGALEDTARGACCPRSDGWRRARSRPASSPRWTRCAGRSSRGRRASTPLAVADREDALSDWLVRHGVERDWLIAPPLRRRRRRRRLVRAGGGAARRRRARGRAGVGRELPVDGDAAVGGEGVDPAGLRPGRRGPVLLAARPGRRCSGPTSPRASRAPW